MTFVAILVLSIVFSKAMIRGIDTALPEQSAFH
jgi:hypothetical protein